MNLPRMAPISKVFLLSLTLTLTGCGGGSSGGGGGETGNDTVRFSGNTAPAEINDANAKEVGLAAGESVDRASASTDLPTALQVSEPIDLDAINDIILTTGEQLTLPSGFEVEGVCSSGSASSSVLSGSKTKLTYNSCLVAGTSATIDGSAVIEFDGEGGTTITYNNLSVTESGTTQTINAVVVCSDLGCTINSDFVGSDGVTHRVSEFSITGDSTAGYNGTATFFHGTHGSVTITVSNVTYGDCGSLPDGGSVSFTSSNGTSGTANFGSDCIVTGTWTNSSGSGSF